MPVYDLPDAVFEAEDGRDAKRHWYELRRAPDPRPVALDLDRVGEIGAGHGDDVLVTSSRRE